MLDGTGSEAFYRALLGTSVDLRFARVEAKAINYTLIRVVDHAFPTSKFAPWGVDAAAIAEARRKKRSDSHEDRLVRFIQYASWLYRRPNADPVLVVVPNKVRKLIEAKLPSNVAVLHFGALRGIDAFRNVPCLIVCGRDMPPMSELELMTEALHFDNPDFKRLIRAEQWPQSERALEMARGPAYEISCERHPDPFVAELQAQLVDAEIEQALGRARLVTRNSDVPCDVYLFGQTSTRIPAQQIINWVDADRDLAEIMVAAGVVFSKVESVAQAFPGLVPAAEDKRKQEVAEAWNRVITGHAFGALTSYCTSYPRNPELRMGSFRLVETCADGRRAFKQDVLIDVVRYADPVEAIALLLNLPPDQIEWLGWSGDETLKPKAERALGGIVAADKECAEQGGPAPPHPAREPAVPQAPPHPAPELNLRAQSTPPESRPN
jgi:hypothetical protein